MHSQAGMAACWQAHRRKIGPYGTPRYSTPPYATPPHPPFLKTGAEIGGRQPEGREDGSKGNGGHGHAATEDGGRLHGGPDAVSHGVLRKKRLFIFL